MQTPGHYRLQIHSNFETKDWKGEKWFVISTNNEFGGKDTFMGMVFICTAIVCLLLASVLGLSCCVTK